MIQASELMIGSYFIDPNYPTLFSKIEQLHSEYAVSSYSDSISYEAMKGVPLTPEVLEKCEGFIFDGNKKYTFRVPETRFVVIIFRDGSGCIECEEQEGADYDTSYGNQIDISGIKFHELQRLILSLTGKSLEVKM